MSRKGALALAAVALLSAGTAACKKQTAEEQLMASLSDQPELREAFVTLKRDFPDQYKQIIDTAAQQQKNGGDPKTAYTLGFTQMQSFMKSQLPNMIQAPDAMQVRYVTAQRDMLKTAQANSVEWCGKIATGRVDATEQPPKALIGPAAKVTQIGLELAKAGKDRPVNRAVFTPGAADAQGLLTALKAQGASPELVQKIGSPGGLLTASPAEACDGVLKMTQAIVAMPPEQAAKWSSFMLRSAG